MPPSPNGKQLLHWHYRCDDATIDISNNPLLVAVIVCIENNLRRRLPADGSDAREVLYPLSLIRALSQGPPISLFKFLF